MGLEVDSYFSDRTGTVTGTVPARNNVGSVVELFCSGAEYAKHFLCSL